MKRILMMTAAVAALASCGNPAEDNTATDNTPETEEIVMSYYGETIDPQGAISIDELYAQMEGKDSLETKVRATINQTCTKMGCWMTVNAGEEEEMTVFMKDHAFFVPKEGCDGKDAIFSGVAYFDTLSVEYLRHLADDAGKSIEEQEAITEPIATLAFDANGVIIEGVPQPAEEEMEEDHEGHDHMEEGEDHEGHDHEMEEGAEAH